MKKLLVVALIVMMLTGCSNKSACVVSDVDTVAAQKFDRYAIGDDYSILVDKETGVCYLEYYLNPEWSSHSVYGITVMLNADGTPKIMEK